MQMIWKRNWGYLIEKNKVYTRCSRKTSGNQKDNIAEVWYGVGNKNGKTITDAIRGLAEYEKKGIEAAKMFEIATDYRYLFVAKNYVFYRIEEQYIRIINIYNEREDFM